MHSLLLLFVLLGCTHHKDHNAANHHMHKNSHSELITTFEDPKRNEWQKPEIVMELIAPLNGKEVIDIGVGSGYFSKHLLNAGAKVTGADVDEKFLHYTRERFSVEKYPNFSILKIDYNDPKMTKEHYDMAFTSNTYHHIENRVEYLKKVKTGLKKDGRLAILDFKKSHDQKAHFGPPQNMRIPIEQVVEELKQAGFQKVRTHDDAFADHYLVIATK